MFADKNEHADLTFHGKQMLWETGLGGMGSIYSTYSAEVRSRRIQAEFFPCATESISSELESTLFGPESTLFGSESNPAGSKGQITALAIGRIWAGMGGDLLRPVRAR
eukprot:1555988-Pyramimonas_sp.AAC.1